MTVFSGDTGTDPYWAYTHIEYCVENQIVLGYGDGYYRPADVVTRDRMVVSIARAFSSVTQQEGHQRTSKSRAARGHNLNACAPLLWHRVNTHQDGRHGIDMRSVNG